MPVTLDSSERMSSPSPKSWISREHPCAAPPSVLEDAPVPSNSQPLQRGSHFQELAHSLTSHEHTGISYSYKRHIPVFSTDRAWAEENGLDVDNILLKAPHLSPYLHSQENDTLACSGPLKLVEDALASLRWRFLYSFWVQL